MFHADAREPLKDTDKVQSIGEGQAMQSMDEQPLEQSADQRALNQPSNQEQADGPTQRNFHPTSVEGTSESQNLAEGQGGTSRGASEQIPLTYPTFQYQAEPGVPVQPDPNAGGPAWNYPPGPEHYQNNAFGQPYTPPGPAVTRPFEQVPTGQFGQPTAPGSFNQTQPGPFGQPVMTPHVGFGQAQPYQQGGPPLPPAQPRRSVWRTGTLLLLALLLAAVFGTGLFAGWQFGHSNTANTNSPTSNGSSLQPGNNSTVTVPQLTGNNADAVREAVISKVQPGVVQILVTTSSAQALGAGVVIDGRGYIVTNNHVVNGANTIQVTLSDGTQIPAKVTGTDAADDLAVIKITPPASGLTTVGLADSSQLRVGQAVLAIGSPLGNTETVTSGIVSALNRNVSEGQNQATLPDAIQTDAPINPGNSGGALVDMQGNLVGIPTLNAINTEFNTPANGLGFAIPSNRIQFIAKQLITNGRVIHTGRAIMGITVTSVDQTVATQNQLGTTSGALIVNVTPGGAAATAGLQAHDVIVQVANKTIHSTTDLSAALLQHNPGDTVAVKVYRGSQQLTVNVTMGELAAS